MFRLIFIFFLILTSVAGRSQTVSVPDSNFRNCLRKITFGIITREGNLDIEKASFYSGNIHCQSRNITNAEGIQYFTAASGIDLDSNFITFLPDISGLRKLHSLDLRANRLSLLPSLDKLKSLKVLKISYNKITSLDVSQNDSLEVLQAHSNQIDTVTSLHNLKKLVHLQLSSNNIRTIPGLAQLQSLQYFAAANNKLRHLSSLDKLDDLFFFDASGNNLSEGPYFGRFSRISTLLLQRNSLTEIPDYSAYSNLRISNLSENNLTFSDLIKLTDNHNFNRIFTLHPQKSIKTLSGLSVKEGDSLLLRTRTDTLLQGVTYEWVKNGRTDTVMSEDYFLTHPVKLTDSGNYYCKIKHRRFPDLYLTTDSFPVRVAPCIDHTGFKVSVLGYDCAETATVIISGMPEVNLTLTSASGKVVTAPKRTFTGLHESRYTVTATAKNGCKTVLDDIIEIPHKECKDFLVTPDNDGNMDTFWFTSTGTVKVFDKRGYMVKEMNIPGEWDCTSNNTKVPVGYYIAYINEGESQIGLSIMY